jgi:molecular chaperone GrpE
MENKGSRRIPIRFLDGGDGAENETNDAPESATPELGQTIEVVCESVADEELDAAAGEAPAEVVSEELSLDVAKLLEEKNALYDRLLRLAAEFENYRKRTDREREQVQERARADVVARFLPVADNFERALTSARLGSDASSLLQGLSLIYKQLQDVLAGLGVTAMETIGTPFDPALHEAISAGPSDEYEENTIMDEYERGYMMGERLLRPARVKVATK